MLLLFCLVRSILMGTLSLSGRLTAIMTNKYSPLCLIGVVIKAENGVLADLVVIRL